MHKHTSILALAMVLLMGCSGTVPTLGVTDGKLTPCPDSPNCVNSQQATTDEEHYIDPIAFSGTAQQAQVNLLHVLKKHMVL